MKHITHIAFSLFLILLLSHAGFSQYYSTGEDPSDIQWKQIDNVSYRIIFPVEQEANAQHIANIIDQIEEKRNKSLLVNPPKFNIILHGRSATSNGMVAWAPKRMELYPVCPQTNTSNVWMDKLVLHEYRHVLQMSKLEQGMGKFLTYLFGQQITGAVVGLYLPKWFLEGDAVCAETAMSEYGRGRLPYFSKGLRAQVLEKGRFSFDKASMGSYKDFVPNHYKLGYHLVAKARENYGVQAWDKVMSNIARHSIFSISGFSKGLKIVMKHKRDSLYESLAVKYKSKDIDFAELKKLNTKNDKKLSLYFDSLDQLKWEWMEQDEKNIESAFVALNKREHEYTNYRFPIFKNDSLLIVRKEGLSHTGRFVVFDIKNHSQEDIFIPGYDFSTAFSYCNNKILWSENKSDKRWAHAIKASLLTYDIETKEKKYVDYENNLFAAQFNVDGSKYLAVEVDTKGNNYISIFSSEDNKLLKKIPANKGEFFISPIWKDSNSLLTISLSTEGKAINEINIENNNTTNIIASSKSDISHLYFYDDNLLFNADYSGIDNIYAYKFIDQKIYKITSSRFGARDASIFNGKIVYSDYTADGYLIAQINYNSYNWTPWNKQKYKFPLAEKISEQENNKLNFKDKKKYKVENYSRLKNLVDMHSWAPIYIDPEAQSFSMGLSMSSQNALNTLMINTGVEFNQDYTKGKYSFNMVYKGFYPVLKSKITYGEGSFYSTMLDKMKFKSTQIENTISLPLNFSRGKKTKFLIPSISLNSSFVNIERIPYTPIMNNYIDGISNVKNNNFFLRKHFIDSDIYFVSSQKTTKKDLGSPWSSQLHFGVGRSIFSGSTDFYYQADASMFIPGFTRHNGLDTYVAFRNQNELSLFSSSKIRNVRGIPSLIVNNSLMMSYTYKQTLLCPDLSLGRFMYIQRIRLNTFFDTEYLQNKSSSKWFNFYSYGIELMGDVNILRHYQIIELGFRYGKENYTNKYFGDLILKINI